MDKCYFYKLKKPNVNYELWVIMVCHGRRWQWWVGPRGSGVGGGSAREKSVTGTLRTFLSFCHEPKKMKPLKKMVQKKLKP